MNRKSIVLLSLLCFGLSIFTLNSCATLKGTAKPNPELAARHVEKGRNLEKKGDLPAALEQYKHALTADPKNSEADKSKTRLAKRLAKLAGERYRLGMKYHRQGKYGLARKEFLTALKYRPDHPEASEMIDFSKQDKATGFVMHTVQPGESLAVIAKKYYGDYKKFDLIAQHNGMDDATQIKVGDRVKVPKVSGLPFNAPALTKSIDKSRKLKAPRSSRTKDQKQLTSKPSALVANRGAQVSAYRDSGIDLYKDGQYEDAIIELSKSVEAIPDDRLTTSYLAKAYFQFGKALFEQRDFEAAREAFENALQYNPKCASCDAYIEKSKSGPALIHRADGIEYLSRNEFAAAIAEFKKFLQAKPGDAEGKELLSKSYFQKALIDYNKGDFMAAKRGFEAAGEYDSQCAKCSTYVNQSLESFKQSHYDKGASYFGTQQLSEAIDEWEMVHELDPGYRNVEQKLKKARALLDKLEKIKKKNKP